MSAEQTTENFWEVWNNFQWPEIKPVSYRCYYRDDGSPDFYTMEDLPGQWIEVSQEIYIQSPMNAKIVDGRFVLIEPKKTVKKLKPSATGIVCDARDICVVALSENKHQYWELCDNEIS